MTRGKKILIGSLAGAVILGLVAANLKFERKKQTKVRTEKVGRRDLESVVSASGKIQAKRQVNVSANTMGKITRLELEEGDRVEKGQFLLQIDPTPFHTSVARMEAALRAAEAQLELEEANREQAELDLRRIGDLHRKNLVPQKDLDAARTAFTVAQARVAAARETVMRERAALENARYDLEKVTIHAELSGVVTRLNVEEGENAVTGTMNNPGTVLMTIADLSEIEAVIEVDETDIVHVETGQEAEVSIDAHPDETFRGVVSKVGNSAISGQSAGGGPQAVNFRVTVTLLDEVPNVRPGLSCTADIVTAVRNQALAVPIQALTIRKPPDRNASEDEENPEPPRDEEAEGEESSQGDSEEEVEEVEGVFVIRDGVARFQAVETGISGERHFEVISGLEENDEVVTGPYRAIRELQDGDAVKVEEPTEEKEGTD